MQHKFVPVMFVLLAALAGVGQASAPIYRSLNARIAYSEAIVIGKVVDAKDLPKWKGPTVWHPTAEVKVRVTETLRGKVPDDLTLQISGPTHNGSQVILFISAIDKNANVNVFEGAQGFNTLDSLTKVTDNAEFNRTLYQALLRMIEHEDHSTATRKPYYPPFGPKGLSVLLELARHNDKNVRTFAVRCLYDLRVTDETGKVLITAIEDDDDHIRQIAAFALIRQKYDPAAEKIAEYARTLPENGLRREAFGYLAAAAPQKYSYRRILENSIRNADHNVHKIFGNSLKALPRGFYVWLKLTVDEHGNVKLVKHRPNLRADEVQAFMKRLILPSSMKLNPIPCALEVHIGYDREKEIVKVSVF